MTKQSSQSVVDRHPSVKLGVNFPRDDNIPNQYKKGWVEFYKLKFKVTPDVLIPRPETELLVDEVLSFIRLNLNQGLTLTHLTILDLGTGAGNIAISCAKYLPTSDARLPARQTGIRIIATDISEKALKVARQNAKLHGVEDKITFIQSNLLSNFNCNLYPVACNLIIVTNLPYIPTQRIPYLDCSVKDFEPHIALDGGEDGFELYRKLFKQIKAKMNQKSAGVNTNPPQGWKPRLIIGEIDYTHGELAINEAQKYFPDAQIEVKKDLTHLQRILMIKF